MTPAGDDDRGGAHPVAERGDDGPDDGSTEGHATPKEPDEGSDDGGRDWYATAEDEVDPMEARELSPFWIDQVADGLGLGRLSAMLSPGSRPIYGPVLLLSLATIVDVVVLSGIEVPEPGVYRITNPGAPALVVGWPLVVLIMIDLRTKYYNVVEKLPGADDELGRSDALIHTRFRGVLERTGLLEGWSREDPGPVVPPRLKYGVLVLAVGLHYVWLFTSPFDVPWVTEVSTWAGAREFLKFYVFTPATYYVAGTEFVTLLATLHVLFPYWIRGTGGIDFSDPLGYAGLRPVGRLVTRSTLGFLVLVTVYAVWVSLPGGIAWSGTVPKLLMGAGSAFAIVMFGAPVFLLHRHIATHKRAKMRAITSRVEEAGPGEGVFPDAEVDDSDDVMEYTHEYINLTRVEDTSEYPVDVQMVQDLLWMLVLPYITGYTSNLLFSYI